MSVSYSHSETSIVPSWPESLIARSYSLGYLQTLQLFAAAKSLAVKPTSKSICYKEFHTGLTIFRNRSDDDVNRKDEFSMIFVHETIYFFFEKKRKSKEILLYNLERILILHIYSSLRRIRKFSNEKFLLKISMERYFRKEI